MSFVLPHVSCDISLIVIIQENLTNTTSQCHKTSPRQKLQVIPPVSTHATLISTQNCRKDLTENSICPWRTQESGIHLCLYLHKPLSGTPCIWLHSCARKLHMCKQAFTTIRGSENTNDMMPLIPKPADRNDEVQVETDSSPQGQR